MSAPQLPELRTIADQLANQRQRWSVRLIAVELGATVAAALLSAAGAFVSTLSLDFEFASAGALIIAIVLQLTTHATRWRHAWFEDRAVAEASLSASWRFMLGCPPFDASGAGAEAFGSVLEYEMRRGSAALQAAVDRCGATALQPSQAMLRVRRRPWRERAAAFREHRLMDQRRWYAAKAGYNARRERVFWIATLGANLLAGMFVVLHFLNPTTNFVGVMTTLAAALMSWSSSRRFRELADSYSALAEQLGELETRISGADSESELIACATAAEEVMTHEHWVWVARRVERHVGLPPLRRSPSG